MLEVAIMVFSARLDGFGTSWESGKQLMDIEVTLGAGKSSSSCKVVLADFGHTIGKALINHASKIGGIKPIESGGDKAAATATPAAASGTASSLPVPKAVAGNGGSNIPKFLLPGQQPVNGGLGTADSMASTGGVFTPEVKAFLDSVVKRESNGATTNIAKSYTSVNLGTGFFDAALLLKSRSQINGYGNYIGRYQMGKLGEVEAKKRFGIAAMTFLPMEQDIMAYNKLIYRGALAPLQAGDVKTAFLKVANEWVSIPNPKALNQQIQAGTTLQEYLDYYQQRLAFYKGTAPPAAKAVANPK